MEASVTVVAKNSVTDDITSLAITLLEKTRVISLLSSTSTMLPSLQS